MALTAKTIQAQRAKQLAKGKKPEDLARKFMSKADVLKEKEEIRKKEDFLKKQADEYDEKKKETDGVKMPEPSVSPVESVPKTSKEISADEKIKKIDKLKREFNSLIGPGSKARKDAIEKVLEELENKREY